MRTNLEPVQSAVIPDGERFGVVADRKEVAVLAQQVGQVKGFGCHGICAYMQLFYPFFFLYTRKCVQSTRRKLSNGAVKQIARQAALLYFRRVILRVFRLSAP